MDITIFIVNFVWVCWMPKEVPPHSVAQAFMLLRYVVNIPNWYFRLFQKLLSILVLFQMLQTLENFHFGTPHAKSGFRVMQRIQRNHPCCSVIDQFDFHFCQLWSASIWIEDGKLQWCYNHKQVCQLFCVIHPSPLQQFMSNVK